MLWDLPKEEEKMERVITGMDSTSKTNIKQYNKKDSSSCELNDDDDTCSDKDCLIAHQGSFC